MATFADMVTLLMAFFVLLLAFSEMDIVKYKAISGSMKRALGVKADSMEITLPDGQKAETAQLRGQAVPQDSPPGSPEAGSMQKDSQTIEKSLEREIKEHKIEVKTWPDRMLIRLPASETFASGRATINPAFLPVLRKIRATLTQVEGSIAVAGHTDDLPISSGRFPSNWELSTARASSVVRVLLGATERRDLERYGFALPEGEGDVFIDPKRVVAQGYGETRPIKPNDSEEHRARNRRVDIILAKKASLRDTAASTGSEVEPEPESEIEGGQEEGGSGSASE
jgi:chemotaxis protein MotB